MRRSIYLIIDILLFIDISRVILNKIVIIPSVTCQLSNTVFIGSSESLKILRRGKRAEIKSVQEGCTDCELSYEVAIAFSSDIKKLSIGSRTSARTRWNKLGIDTRETSTALRQRRRDCRGTWAGCSRNVISAWMDESKTGTTRYPDG